MNEKANRAHAAYQRRWAKSHPESIAKSREKYWTRKAEEAERMEAANLEAEKDNPVSNEDIKKMSNVELDPVDLEAASKEEINQMFDVDTETADKPEPVDPSELKPDD